MAVPPSPVCARVVRVHTSGRYTESLRVIRSLADLADVMDMRRCRFIPTSRAGGLWILEELCGFGVRLYLAVVAKGDLH